MSKPDVKQIQEQLELLQKENEQLRRKLQLVTGGPATGSMTLGSLTMVGHTRAPQATIAGLSVAYLIVDKSFRVIKMNTRMSDFIGVGKQVIDGKPNIVEIDTLEWAPGVFQTLLQDALESASEETFEAERPSGVSGKMEYFQFKAVWVGGQGTVTVEDVTRLKVTRQFFERLVSPRIVEQLLDVRGPIQHRQTQDDRAVWRSAQLHQFLRGRGRQGRADRVQRVLRSLHAGH